MNETSIEWADFTWNPIVGCRNGCSYCYARRVATTRLAHLCPQCATFEPHLHPERMEQPTPSQKPAVIFADSMADWWSEGVDEDWRHELIWKMEMTRNHRFIILTKQPTRLTVDDVKHWPSNAWLGVSITSGADWWRWEALAKLPERIHKLISVEPLLGPGVAEQISPDVERVLGLDGRDGPTTRSTTVMPEWVIAGPLTKAGRRLMEGGRLRPIDVVWISRLRYACAFAGIPLFEKDGFCCNPIRQMPPDLAAVFRKKEILTCG